MTITIKPHRLALSAILAAALFIRLFSIEMVPAGITRDELDYYMGGKILAFTGQGLSDSWHWWQLKPMRTGTLTAEIIPWLFVPANWLFNTGLTGAKITPVMFGVISCLLMYYLMVKLSKGNRNVGLIAALLICVNPWHIMLSRTAYEISIAITGYLLFLTGILRVDVNKSGWPTNLFRIAVALLGLSLGYFGYHGFKFLAPLVVIAGIIGLYLLTEKQNRFHPGLVVAVGATVLTCGGLMGHTYFNRDIYTSRQRELDLINFRQVDDQISLASQTAMSGFLNDFVFKPEFAWFSQLGFKYLEFFSPLRLFYAQSEWFSSTLSEHGYFYLIEILLVAAGLSRVGKHKPYWLLPGLWAISPIPSLIHQGNSYVIRSAFAIIPITALSAVGLNYLLAAKKLKLFKNILLLVLMTTSVGYFFYLYLTRFGTISFDRFMGGDRVVNSYIDRLNDETSVTVATTFPEEFYRTALFYQQAITSLNAAEIRTRLIDRTNPNYRLNNITITNSCEAINHGNDMVIIEEKRLADCDATIDTGNLRVISPDGIPLYRIIRPRLCGEMANSSRVTVKNLKQLKVEDLSNAEFCEIYISKPI